MLNCRIVLYPLALYGKMLAFPTLSSRRASDGSVVCAVTRTVHRDARARRRDRRSERPAPAGRAHQTPASCRPAGTRTAPGHRPDPLVPRHSLTWRRGVAVGPVTGRPGRVECEWGRAERGESSAARRRRERAVLLSRIPAMIIPTATPPSAPRGHGLGKLRFALAIGPGRRPATGFLTAGLRTAPARRYTRYLRPLALTGARSTTPAAGATAARAARARSAGRGRTGREWCRPGVGAPARLRPCSCTHYGGETPRYPGVRYFVIRGSYGTRNNCFY